MRPLDFECMESGADLRFVRSRGVYAPLRSLEERIPFRVQRGIGVEAAEGQVFSRGNILLQFGGHLTCDIGIFLRHIGQFFRITLQIVELGVVGFR